MEQRSLEEVKNDIEKLKEEKSVEDNKALVVTNEHQEMQLQEKMNDVMKGLMENAVDSNKDELKDLTNTAVKNEIEIRKIQTEGRKQKEKARVEREISDKKKEEDDSKHERNKTVLKAMGLTNPLPKPFRIAALSVGFPFFVLYLLTLGWVIEFFTFVIKGFITMIADCAERFAEVNKKFIENDNTKDFKLGKAILSVVRWLIIIGAVVAIIILFVVR